MIDYRGAFYSTIRNRWGLCSFNLEIVKQEFQKFGVAVHIRPFASIDLREEDFKNRIVLYQSSEDPDSCYKEYIEDLLLGIQLQGGILIPHFHCFRAHHNKVFMEVLRDISADPLIQARIKSKYFGVFEDFDQQKIHYPVVLKRAWGAGSKGVRLARRPVDARQIAFRFSRSANWTEGIKELYRRVFRRNKGYVSTSLNRRKFVTQEFIPDLTGDLKVLAYWDKYYLLSRKNRTNDFRASGSGYFSWPEEPPTKLLDYAKHVFKHFNVPLVSLDIAMSGETPVLIEYQFLCFGTLTMENADWYFVEGNQGWEKIQGRSIPEVEFVRSVAAYLESGSLIASSIR